LDDRGRRTIPHGWVMNEGSDGPVAGVNQAGYGWWVQGVDLGTEKGGVIV
jgi:hypothetical protein